MNKILLVEDNERNLKLFKRIIDSLVHQVLTARDGEEGVRLAKENTPNLILMDIQIPVMSGSEALRILRADPTTKDIPVIALTSYAMRGDKERFLCEGFDDYISKPINTKKFIEIVKKHIPHLK